MSLSSNPKKQKVVQIGIVSHHYTVERAKNRKVIFVAVSFMQEKDCDEQKPEILMGSNALFSMCYPPRHFQALEF